MFHVKPRNKLKFKKATTKAKRLKMYIYGSSGVGKTVTALQFPNSAVIDTERGTDFYGDKFDFSIIQTKDINEAETAVENLLADPGDFKTLVIDPFTLLYEDIKSRHLRRLRSRNNNPHYDFQPRDYGVIKADTKEFINRLLALDMNIIVTARSKPQYSSDDFMKKIGEQPDGPAELPYLFDVVLELYQQDELRMAKVKKDRTNKLPKEDFEFNYNNLVEYFGIDGIERMPDIFTQKKTLDELSGRSTLIVIDGKNIMTAGINADQINKIQAKLATRDPEKVMEQLQADYGVKSFLDLRSDEADLFINSIE